MTEARDVKATTSDPSAIGAVTDERVTALRGPAVVSVGRRFWIIIATLGLFVFAVTLVVSVVSTTNDNATIVRMKTHGIPVNVTVAACIGTIGGSGSNSAGYTCHGDYRVSGVTYHELIGSMTTFSEPGSTVRAMVDPAHHSTVVLASAVRTSRSSAGAYVPSGLLVLVLIALSVALRRVARRPGSSPSEPRAG